MELVGVRKSPKLIIEFEGNLYRHRIFNSCMKRVGSSQFTQTTRVEILYIKIKQYNLTWWEGGTIHYKVYVVVNFLFQLIFIYPLFWGMVMHANEFNTKEKQKITEIKNELQHIYLNQLNRLKNAEKLLPLKSQPELTCVEGAWK